MRFKDVPWGIAPRAWQAAALARATEYMSSKQESRSVVRAIMGAGKSVFVSELLRRCQLDADEVIVVSTPTELLTRQLHHTINAAVGAGIWYGKRKRFGRVVVSCAKSTEQLGEYIKAKKLRVALYIPDEAHCTECDMMHQAVSSLHPTHIMGVTATPFLSEKNRTLSIFDEQIFEYGVASAIADRVVVPWDIVGSHSGGDVDFQCIDFIRSASDPGIANATSIEDAKGFATTLRAAGVRAEAVHSQMPFRAVSRHVRALEAGNLSCIVHVDLLCMGADYPWLRWLCMRRRVGSRVRFAQEIGRVLRSHPGKDYAVFFDPHDLFGTFKLTYAEALGDIQDEPITEEVYLELDDKERGEMLIEERNGALSRSLLEMEIRRLSVACEASGILRRRVVVPVAQRTKRSQAIQHVEIKKAISAVRSIDGLVPESYDSILDSILDGVELVRRGWAGDLLAAMKSIGKAKRWPNIVRPKKVYSMDDFRTRPQPQLPFCEWDNLSIAR